jgi:hypothetical protein
MPRHAAWRIRGVGPVLLERYLTCLVLQQINKTGTLTTQSIETADFYSRTPTS